MDITHPRVLYTKAALFVCGGVLASGIILIEHPSLKLAALLALAVWCFGRAYYFAFYVVQHYIDPTYRFAGLGSFVMHLLQHKRALPTPASERTREDRDLTRE